MSDTATIADDTVVSFHYTLRDDTGTFNESQQEQVRGVIKNTEAREIREHPLSRIMGIERRPEGLVISTTDTHLPRRIGEALKHAYHGELELHYDHDEDFVRVNWRR